MVTCTKRTDEGARPFGGPPAFTFRRPDLANSA